MFMRYLRRLIRVGLVSANHVTGVQFGIVWFVFCQRKTGLLIHRVGLWFTGPFLLTPGTSCALIQAPGIRRVV